MEKISRRKFIQLSTLTAAMLALQACKPGLTGNPTPVPSLPVPRPSVTPEATLVPTLKPTQAKPGALDPQTMRVLNRITFGAGDYEIERVAEIGLDNYIDEQLAPAKKDNPLLEKKLADFKYIDAPIDELVKVQTRDPAVELGRAAILRAVYSRWQVFEMMVDFWTNHFNIYIGKQNEVFLKVVDDREVIRAHALGTFPKMLAASSKSPAMMVYLDNAVSTKNKPNENYARELLELHTLSPAGGYTQADVGELARILTGWAVAGARQKKPGTFLFNNAAHDAGAKTLLGKSFPAGRGVAEGEEAVAMLAEHPAAASFLCQKLVRRFLADDPPASLVNSAAKTFTQSKGDMRKVLGAILHSQEFQAAPPTRFKRPFEYLVSALRVTRSDTSADQVLISYLDRMGQPLFRWETPDGFPDNSETWTTANGLLVRWNFALALAANAVKETKVDFQQIQAKSTDLTKQLDALGLALLGGKLPAEAAQVIQRAVQSQGKNALPAAAALILSSPLFMSR